MSERFRLVVFYMMTKCPGFSNVTNHAAMNQILFTCHSGIIVCEFALPLELSYFPSHTPKLHLCTNFYVKLYDNEL